MSCLRCQLLAGVVGKPEAGALGAHAVGKFNLGTVADVHLDLLPVAAFVLNFLAGSTDGQDAAERIHTCECLLKLRDQLVFSGFFVLAVADVAAVDDHAADDGVVEQIVGDDFERNPGAVSVTSTILEGTPRAGSLYKFS